MKTFDKICNTWLIAVCFLCGYAVGYRIINHRDTQFDYEILDHRQIFSPIDDKALIFYPDLFYTEVDGVNRYYLGIDNTGIMVRVHNKNIIKKLEERNNL